MKITHVIPFYAPAWGYGGPVRVSYDIANEFAKCGHEVSVWTTDAYDHSKRIGKLCEEMDGVKIRRFKNLSNKLAKGYNLFLPTGFKKYCKLNLKTADIIHLHSFYTVLNVVAAKYARKYKIPYIIHLHELPVAETMFGKVLIKKIFLAIWGKNLLKGASKVLALTQSEKELTLKAYPFLKGKIEVLPNAISLNKPLANSNLRKKYGYLDSNKIILSLSRLSNLKRVDKVINIFSIICSKDPSYRLIIAGPDEMGNLAKLKALAQKLEVTEKIKFTGAVVGPKKEHMYQISDLYMLLADYESFSITTLEAIFYGVLPVVSSKVGLAKDLEPSGAAVVIKTDSPEKTAELTMKAYDERRKYYSNMRSAIGRFSLKNISYTLETIYSGLNVDKS